MPTLRGNKVGGHGPFPPPLPPPRVRRLWEIWLTFLSLTRSSSHKLWHNQFVNQHQLIKPNSWASPSCWGQGWLTALPLSPLYPGLPGGPTSPWERDMNNIFSKSTSISSWRVCLPCSHVILGVPWRQLLLYVPVQKNTLFYFHIHIRY